MQIKKHNSARARARRNKKFLNWTKLPKGLTRTCCYRETNIRSYLLFNDKTQKYLHLVYSDGTIKETSNIKHSFRKTIDYCQDFLLKHGHTGAWRPIRVGKHK